MSTLRKKLVLIGDEKCGKTSLLESFLEYSLIKSQTSKSNDYCKVYFETAGKQVNFDIVETVSHDNLMLRPYSYINAHILVIVFSLVNQSSFHKVSDKWVPEVKHFCPEIPFIIIGNKKDLRTDIKTINELRLLNQEAIKKEEGQALSKTVGAYAYLECSTKTTEGIQHILETAAQCTMQEKRYDFLKEKCNLF